MSTARAPSQLNRRYGLYKQHLPQKHLTVEERIHWDLIQCQRLRTADHKAPSQAIPLESRWVLDGAAITLIVCSLGIIGPLAGLPRRS